MGKDFFSRKSKHDNIYTPYSMTKICSRCKIKKNTNDFDFRNKKNGWLFSWCKQCRKDYYNENKEHFQKYKKNYKKENKEKIKQQDKEYRKKNKERLKLKDIDYRKNNKKKLKEYYNKNKIKNRVKQWKIKNKKKSREWYRYYKKLRFLNDPNFKLRHLISHRINEVLKKQKVNKNNSTLKLLGCNLNFFKNYLESQFTKEMSWSNHGIKGWHIDHKRPCISFDLTDPEQQKICFHYSNL